MNQETLTIPGIPTPVSRIALGTWAGSRGAADAAAVSAIRSALDQGINLIDTDPIYGMGQAELRVGRALAGGRRRRAVIATKLEARWEDHAGPGRKERIRRIRRDVETSLRRLRTDYIDLFQVHWPDTQGAIEDTAEELEKLRKDGKVLALGVGNHSPAQMRAFASVAPLSAVQALYNVFERDIDAGVLPHAVRHDMVVLTYGTLCRGLLSGQVTEDTRFDGDDMRQCDPRFAPMTRGLHLAAVAALDEFACLRFRRGVAALALRWVLDRGPTIAVWGARQPQDLALLSQISGWKLDEADMAAIEAIVNCYVPPIADGFLPASRFRL